MIQLLDLYNNNDHRAVRIKRACASGHCPGVLCAMMSEAETRALCRRGGQS